MNSNESTREMVAMLKLRGIEAEPYHTGGNCWVAQVTLDDGYIWISDMDGPWMAGHYAADEEQPSHGWLADLDPEGATYTAEAAASIVARYVNAA